jgi:hypothetical protein
MSRERVGLAVLAMVFVGVGAYACSSSSFGPQPFIDDVPSSSTTAPPAPEDMDAPNEFPDSSLNYDTDAAYPRTLCESTCTCDIGKKEYCVGQFTGLTFATCEVPDAGAGVDSGEAAFRDGCNKVPAKCLAGGPPYCPCIISSLTALPCLPECVDETNGQVELFCNNP